MTNGINDTSSVKKIIGRRIATAREEQGITRPKLVEMLNKFEDRPITNGKSEEMAVERLKQWEYGNNPVALEWMPLLCRALSCDIGYLFGEYDERRRQTSDICKETGLNERSANYLQALQNAVTERPYSSFIQKFYLKMLNTFLCSNEFWGTLEFLRDAYIVKNRLAFNGFAPPYPNEEETGDKNEHIKWLKQEFNIRSVAGLTDDYIIGREEMAMVYLRRAGDIFNNMINRIIETGKDGEDHAAKE